MIAEALLHGAGGVADVARRGELLMSEG